MNSVFTVLLKTIILPFYRSHAGLLFFVFYVMFGMVEPGKLLMYHQTLIEAMFTSTAFMLCVYLVWTLYSLKSLHFILSLLRHPEYQFLNTLMLISKVKAFRQLLLIVGIAFLPIIVYSGFIYRIGISQHHYTTSIGILSFQIALCFLNAWIILTFLRTQHVFLWAFARFRIPNTGGRIGFYVSHFLTEEKIALLISKTFSLVLLYIVREAMEADDDLRILELTWVFVLLSHSFLVPKVRMFEDRYLTWIKSLPFSTFRNCLLYFVFYTGLILPELVFSISMVGNIVELIPLALLSGGLLMAIHVYLLKLNRDPEKFSTYLFWIFMLSFLAILSKLIIPLILVLLVMVWILIKKRYYEYEPAVD